MASPAQLSANRANAKLSTGPRSAEGKAASSRNAVKLGIYSECPIIKGEDPASLKQLTDAYYAHFEPVGPVEAMLVDTCIRTQWTMQRLVRIEAEIYDLRTREQENSDLPLGAGFVYDTEHGDSLMKIARRLLACQREWHKCLKALRDLQRTREGLAFKARVFKSMENQLDDRPVPNIRVSNPHDPDSVRSLVHNRVTIPASPAPSPDPAINPALRL